MFLNLLKKLIIQIYMQVNLKPLMKNISSFLKHLYINIWFINCL